MNLPFRRLHPSAIVPSYARENDAGLDLAAVDSGVICQGQTRLIHTGLAVAIPDGYFGLIAGRSGMAIHGLVILGGVIDSGYRGEIKVMVGLHSKMPFEWQPGVRVAQLLVLPNPRFTLVEVDELDETDRGTAGFGSSGA